MGKQKKNCWKCGSRHVPPTGKKCENIELLSDENISVPADVAAVRSENEDSFAIPGTLKSSAASGVQGAHDDLQLKILDQLQKVNQRFDKVEGRMAEEQHSGRGQDSKRKKLSTFSKRHMTVVSDNSQSDSDSSDQEQYMPSLNTIRKSGKIVDKLTKELGI